jgi:hypothetical protein
MTAISTDEHIKIVFQTYRRANVSLGFTSVGALTGSLNKAADRARAQQQDAFAADAHLARLFLSAAVEMWHRAVHSFIVSAALTSTSALWSAVAGYYASHYVMRGYAHLLGRYLLYRQKRVVVLKIQGSGFYCQLDSKHGSDREHKAYWRFVRESEAFRADPFVAVDVDVHPVSDGAHRNAANYSDHINHFDTFDALTRQETVQRIERISDIEVTAPPIPNADKYPDLQNVQLIAYHRIVRFRSYLDNLLGSDIRFWNAHRTPSWCKNVVDFQIVEPQFLQMSGQQ